MRNKAFTLIELLVVVAIIGLLSSVVVASLNAARNKARLNSAKHFAAQAERAAGDMAVGIWDFDECSGTVTADRSGGGNNGTLLNMATSSWSSDTPSGIGCSLVFDGANDVVQSSGEFANFGITSFSGFAWVKSTDTSGSVQKRIFGRDFVGPHWIWLNFGNGTSPYIEARDNSLVSWNQSASASIADGEWHHIGFVIDRSENRVSVYIDGKLGGTKTVSSSGAWTTTGTYNFYIGGQCTSGCLPFMGSIDSIRIFNKSLTASEVEGFYASEAAEYGLAKAR